MAATSFESLLYHAEYTYDHDERAYQRSYLSSYGPQFPYPLNQVPYLHLQHWQWQNNTLQPMPYWHQRVQLHENAMRIQFEPVSRPSFDPLGSIWFAPSGDFLASPHKAIYAGETHVSCLPGT